MVDRLPEELRRLASAGISPVFVLLMGGTNDLDWTPAADILVNLKKLRAIASRASAIPVALAVPVADFGASARDAVNAGLRSEVAAEEGSLFADVSSVGEELTTA
eukprot:gnl/TRDRNA2_/TRDRNA2_158619_c0_seq2.p1 gnl/TRDRNA2_/TRDRNA2_158619_c0~~gnl/TRDRNA2_/TRDRNA2_158619_c0_seq2.p1  ORF type:complete len:105 (-),score=26.54 gnl/TRDRNA2_/TRDRNA2_158619_c0_seq2:147-461(-)